MLENLNHVARREVARARQHLCARMGLTTYPAAGGGQPPSPGRHEGPEDTRQGFDAAGVAAAVRRCLRFLPIGAPFLRAGHPRAPGPAGPGHESRGQVREAGASWLSKPRPARGFPRKSAEPRPCARGGP